jgi:predicted AAA+ superfamily ATPase
METYLPRITDRRLQELLQCIGAVLIEGPKWCGKTTTAEQQAASVIRLQDPDLRIQIESAIKTKPSILLQGENPRLIDEWQMYPILWDSVRTVVDQRARPGQFILTGSNSVDHNKIMHSGTGRIARLKMYPMSLFESRESCGKISLSELFANPNMEIDGITSPMSVEDIIFASCRGGWQATLQFSETPAQLFTANTYIDSLCSVDSSSIDGVRRDPMLMRYILRSYARNVSTLSKKNVLLSDIQENISCSERTLDDYLSVLRQLFVIEELPAWNPSIRSASAIRSGVKRQFVDPSIAVAALELSPAMLLNDLNTFGFIFETLCCRDLRIYSSALGGHLSYYRDRYGLEADAVMHLSDGRYALFEFKLGSAQVDDGAKHLLEISRLVEATVSKGKSKMRNADLCIVITGGEYAHRRDDGVLVIPIGCLKD